MNNVLLPILLVACLIIAVQLTRVGRQGHLTGLLWLDLSFYITALGDIAYSFTALVAPMATILDRSSNFIPSLHTLLTQPSFSTMILFFTLLGIILEYLAWVMPKAYRRFLNRKYQPMSQDAEFYLKCLRKKSCNSSKPARANPNHIYLLG